MTQAEPIYNPVRIQRKRVKGWRMPPGTVYVGRGSPWGNRFRVGVDGTPAECVRKYAQDKLPYTHHGPRNGMGDFLLSQAVLEEMERQLKGRNVACWCGLCERHKDGKPLGVACQDCETCHGDWLLDVVNG